MANNPLSERINAILSEVRKILGRNPEHKQQIMTCPMVTINYDPDTDKYTIQNIRFMDYDSIDVTPTGCYFVPEHGKNKKLIEYSSYDDLLGVKSGQLEKLSEPLPIFVRADFNNGKILPCGYSCEVGSGWTVIEEICDEKTGTNTNLYLTRSGDKYVSIRYTKNTCEWHMLNVYNEKVTLPDLIDDTLKPEPTRVYIFKEHGMYNEIYSNDPNAKVAIFDLDDESASEHIDTIRHNIFNDPAVCSIDQSYSEDE